MHEQEIIGKDEFMEAFNRRQPLVPLMNRLTNDAIQGYWRPLSGAWTAATSIIDLVNRRQMTKFTGSAAGWTGQAFRRQGQRLMALQQYKEFASLAGLLVGMLDGLRMQKPDLVIVETPEPVAPPPPPPEPALVRVVGLPVRQVTTQVERDAAGSIVGTHQIESDLVADERAKP